VGNGYGFFAPTSLRQVSFPPPGLHDHRHVVRTTVTQGRVTTAPRPAMRGVKGPFFAAGIKRNTPAQLILILIQTYCTRTTLRKTLPGWGEAMVFLARADHLTKPGKSSNCLVGAYGWYNNDSFNAGATKLVERSG